MVKLAATAIVLLILPGVALSPPTGQSAASLFDSYEAGQFDAVPSLLRTAGFEELRRSVQRAATDWVSRDRVHSSRRRLIVATVALEIIEKSLNHWDDGGRDFVEWACSSLRRNEGVRPTAGEQAWYFAALALMQGAYDSEAVKEHLRHLDGRLERDPRSGMARAVALEWETWPIAKQPIAEDESAARERARRAYVLGYSPSHRDWRASKLWDLKSVLEGLTDVPAVMSEAHLRLGFVYLRLGRTLEGLDHLQIAEKHSDDPFVRFLARYFRGRAIHSTDPDAAIDAYRRALEVVPRAQSASISLAALLFAQGKTAEPASLSDAALTKPHAADPWRFYQQGYYRSWQDLIGEIRAALR